MKKKVMSILLATFVATSLTACGSKENSTTTTTNSESTSENNDNSNSTETVEAIPIEEITIDFNVENVENDVAKVSYPSDEWTYFEEEKKAFIFSPKSPVTENETSVVMIAIDSRASTLEETTKTILDEVSNSIPGTEVISEQYTNLGDEQVAYIETKAKITDEVLDKLIKDGVLTEKTIKESGGREALKSKPESKQLLLIFEKDGKEISITGTYYDDSEKDSVLKAMKTLAQTVEIK